MGQETKLNRFAKFAWFVLGWNIVVILWGVFLRASKSGDGCGQHWLTCNGEVVPSAPELKTIIEFSHRVTSSMAGLLLIVLLVWAIRRWYVSRSKRDWLTLVMAGGSFVFVVIEGLLGRSLVLTGNTAMNLTPERPFWMAAHLVNTLILVAFVALTAWLASRDRSFEFPVGGKHYQVICLAVAAIFLVGMSGSVAALSSMIFPSGTLVEGVAKDFSETSNIILRIRPLHPFLSILTAVYLIFASGWLKKESGNAPGVTRWSNILSIVVLVQVLFGAATLLTLAPIVMQLGHLFLADTVWISFVLLTASFMANETVEEVVANAPNLL